MRLFESTMTRLTKRYQTDRVLHDDARRFRKLLLKLNNLGPCASLCVILCTMRSGLVGFWFVPTFHPGPHNACRGRRSFPIVALGHADVAVGCCVPDEFELRS